MRDVKLLIEAFENRRLKDVLDVKSRKYSDELMGELFSFLDDLYSYLDENNIFVFEVSENIGKFYLRPIFDFDEISDYFDFHNSVFISSIHEDLWEGKSRYVSSIHKKLISEKYFCFLDVIANLIASCFRDVVKDEIKIVTVRKAYASLIIAKSLRVYETMSVGFDEVYAKQNSAQIKIYDELFSYVEGFELDRAIKLIVAEYIDIEYDDVVEFIHAKIEKEVFRPMIKSNKYGQDISDKWGQWGVSMINHYYSEKISNYL